MKSRSEVLFQAVLALGDAGATVLAFLLGYWIRYGSGRFSAPRGVAGLEETAASLGYVLVIWLIVFHACGLYQSRHRLTLLDEFYSVLIAVTLAVGVFLAAAFLTRSFWYSRGVLAVGWILDVIMVTGTRTILRSIRAFLQKAGRNLRSVWIFGEGDAAQQARSLFARADLGTTVIGQSTGIASVNPPEVIAGLPWDHIEDMVIAEVPDGGGHDFLRELVVECERREIAVHFIPTFSDLLRRQGLVEVIDGIPLVTLRSAPAAFWHGLLKRAFDIAISLAMLIVLALPMAAIAALVKLTSPGPVIFSQDRTGKGGKPFRMLKFRTIAGGAREASMRSGGEHPGLTGLGRWLRRFSLDELPQLFNVLLGEMSLVGPRPEQPQFVDQLSQQVPGYKYRHRVKTGLTGWAQVHDLRGGDTSIEERTRYDLYYVENWSLLLDLKILVKTGFEVLFHRHAK